MDPRKLVILTGSLLVLASLAGDLEQGLAQTSAGRNSDTKSQNIVITDAEEEAAAARAAKGLQRNVTNAQRREAAMRAAARKAEAAAEADRGGTHE